MKYEVIFVSLSCALMTLYLVGYALCRGLPCSISDTYYHTARRWLFGATIGASGGLALVPLLNVTPRTYQFVVFFIVASILFVAAAPAFKEELTHCVHYGAASVLGLSATTWLILTTGVPWIAIGGGVTGVLDRRRCLFWIEVGLLYNLYVSLISLLT